MSTPATYDDVSLILRIYELRREPRMREARKWFNTFNASNLQELAEKAPMGSEENASLRMVTTYWEMVASFLNSGVLNEELFYQTGIEMLACWIRMERLVPQMREAFKMNILSSNLERASKRYIEYLNRTAPGTVEGIEARIRG